MKTIYPELDVKIWKGRAQKILRTYLQIVIVQLKKKQAFQLVIEIFEKLIAPQFLVQAQLTIFLQQLRDHETHQP